MWGWGGSRTPPSHPPAGTDIPSNANSEHVNTKSRDIKGEDTAVWKDDDGNAMVVPTSFASWASGVLSGRKDSWFVDYLEAPIFKQVKKSLQEHTGFNIDWLVILCVSANSAKTEIPKYAHKLLEQFKAQATSSVMLQSNSPLRTNLLKFVRELEEKSDKSQFTFRGRHEECFNDLEFRPLPGEMKQMFCYNGTLFIIDEVKGPGAQAKPLVIRCFGHSNEPIINLLQHIKDETSKSEELTVWKESAGDMQYTMTRDKRPFASVDLEPEMAKQILQEVQDFFHEGSKKLYMETSRPWRHGFLFSGPPGTGKTSLSVAIASVANVDLVMIDLQGMDDNDLERVFARLPTPCVVLLEDIDACSADVARRTPLAKTDHEESRDDQEKITQAEAASMIAREIAEFRKEYSTALVRFGESQTASHQEIMDQIQRYLESNPNNYRNRSDDDDDEDEGEKHVTLSGLLNVIDGASAKEGRLLIMTTNHPELLDEALTRVGRCDSKFHIGYATPNSAEQTFKRIFGADPCRKFTLDAIDKLAQAFKQQFPEYSKVPTCDLAKYCGLYRNRPLDAIRDFPEYLEKGDEMFVWHVRAPEDEDIGFNVARSYDEDLLEIGQEDMIEPPVVDESADEQKPELEKSTFNPLRWFGRSKGLKSSEPQLLISDQPFDDDDTVKEEFASFDGGFCLADVEYDEWPAFELVGKITSFVRSVVPKTASQDTSPLQITGSYDLETLHDLQQRLLAVDETIDTDEDPSSTDTYVDGQHSSIENVVPPEKKKKPSQQIEAHRGNNKDTRRYRKPDTQRRKGKKRTCKGFDADLEDWTFDNI